MKTTLLHKAAQATGTALLLTAIILLMQRQQGMTSSLFRPK